jgi:aminoglycoside phosphotransferase
VWKPVARTFDEIIGFEQEMAAVIARTWCRCSAARQHKMSLERRATCSVRLSHSSTFVTSKLTIDKRDRLQEHLLVPNVCKVRSSTKAATVCVKWLPGSLEYS